MANHIVSSLDNKIYIINQFIGELNTKLLAFLSASIVMHVRLVASLWKLCHFAAMFQPTTHPVVRPVSPRARLMGRASSVCSYKATCLPRLLDNVLQPIVSHYIVHYYSSI